MLITIKFTFSYIVVDLKKLDCHVLVGTPKEMVSFQIMRLFNIEQITMCVIDDADAINTSKIVQENIVLKLKACRKILVSATSLRSAMVGIHNCEIISGTEPKNMVQFFMKCPYPAMKLEAIQIVYKALVECGGKAIVFLNVIIQIFKCSIPNSSFFVYLNIFPEP